MAVISAFFCNIKTACAENSNELLVQFYDKHVLLIDEYTISPDKDDNQMYGFPITAEYVRIDMLSNVNDVNILINENQYGDNIFYEISNFDDFDINVTFCEDQTEQVININLQRNSRPRANLISSIQWRVGGQDGQFYYPDDMTIEQKTTKISIPYSSSIVYIDAVSAECKYCDVNVYKENGDSFDVNEQSVELVLSDMASRFFIESMIDNETGYYEIIFEKADTPSNDTTLSKIELMFSDPDGIYEAPTVECQEGLFDYELIIPKEISEFYLSVHPQDIAATVRCFSSDSLIEDMVLFIDEEMSVKILVQAEDGNDQEYTLNIIRSQEASTVDAIGNNDASGMDWVWILIGAVILITIFIFVYKKMRAKKSTH